MEMTRNLADVELSNYLPTSHDVITLFRQIFTAISYNYLDFNF